MKERPILFSAPMIRAILEGKKTQTRRAVSPGNSFFGSAPVEFWKHADFNGAWPDGGKGGAQYLHVPCHESPAPCAECERMDWWRTSHRLWSRIAPSTDGRILNAERIAEQREAPASRLWVRETLTVCGEGIEYAADDALLSYLDGDDRAAELWNQYAHKDGPDLHPTKIPSIFMPRWASRITLEVTDVRVQRLQDISEDDAIAEGATLWQFGPEQCLTSGERGAASPFRSGFACLWDDINADRATWKSNPWVWAIIFKAVTR